jgi:hypothetical protein
MIGRLFRRRLEPLKPQTLVHDEKIVGLDRELAEERGAGRESQRRLDSFIIDLGEQFASVARQLTDRLVDPNGMENRP